MFGKIDLINTQSGFIQKNVLAQGLINDVVQTSMLDEVVVGGMAGCIFVTFKYGKLQNYT